MALITTVTKVYQSEGRLQNTALFAIFNADASDTVSFAADFYSITSAFWTPSTGSSTAGTATPSGTTCTIPSGANNDDGWLQVTGARVQSITSP